MKEDEIVHVSPVVPDTQFFFDKEIERVEIEIGENLAREVPYRETDSYGSEKQALVPRKSLPIHSLSFDNAILRRVISDDRPHKETERFRILSGVLRIDDILNHREENSSVDGHEKSCDVEFEYMCLVSEVVGGCPHKTLHPRNPE